MKRRIFVSLVLAAAISNTQAQKLALTKGQKLETVTTTTTKMDVMGQAITNETTSNVDVEVKNVTPESFEFTNVIKRMMLKGSAMGQDMNFDSDKKEDLDGQIGQSLKGKINVPQQIQVDKRGKVISVSDAEGVKKSDMADMMSIGNELAKGQPYSFLIQLPGRTVKPGDSWTDSTGDLSTVKTVTTYKLKSMSADGALVTYTGSVAKKGTIEQNEMQIQVELTGNTNGESLYDANTGLLKSNNGTVEMTGNMGMMGQSVPMSATVTAKTVAKKL